MQTHYSYNFVLKLPVQFLGILIQRAYHVCCYLYCVVRVS